MNGAFIEHYPEQYAALPPRQQGPRGIRPDMWHERKDRLGNGKPITGAYVEFINVGQTLVWLNEHIPIMPAGGYYAEANPFFDAVWEFNTLGSPPPLNGKICQAGNHLIIILHKNPGSAAQLWQPANVGSLSIGYTAPASSFVSFSQSAGIINIPAGVTSFSILNRGGISPTGLCTVNGGAWPPCETPITWDRKNQATEAKTSPAMVIVPNGDLVQGHYFT